MAGRFTLDDAGGLIGRYFGYADRARLEHIAQVYADQGWPAPVDDEGTAPTALYSAPSAGPPPWHAYEVTPTKVIAVGGDPGGATAFDL